MSVSTAVAVQDKGQQIIAQYEGDFALVLPSHIKPEAFVRLAQGLLRRNPALTKVVQKNPGSFLAALLDCARLGLEPGDTYHFVPFGDEVVGITDYTGEIELMYRAGEVSSVKAEIVHEHDHFVFSPDMDKPDHKPDWFGDRGEMIGVYAYAVMKNGATSRVVMMNRAEVERVKAVSKTANRSDSPWKVWPDRMWLKTAVKQLAKWTPSSPEYRTEIIRATAAAHEVVSRPSLLEIPPVAHDYEDDDAEVVDGQLVP